MRSEVSISPNRVQITRRFDAPRALVFAFWKSPEKVKLWTGCKEATRCEVEMDFRVGGAFRQKMHIEGAGDFTLTGQYDEIVEPERIVYHANLGSATTRVTVEFFEQGGQTRMVLTHDGLPDEFHCKTVSQGTGESFDKLQRLLASGKGQA